MTPKAKSLALIAGRGALPTALAQAVDEPPLICALEGNPPDVVQVDRVFRLEHLGSLLYWLRGQNVRDVCLCGHVARPDLSWKRLDLRTIRHLPRILRALRRGDDGALRIALDLFEEAGFRVLGAHEVAPDLLLAEGVHGSQMPPDARELARIGDEISAEQAARDLGQACVLRHGEVIAREDEAGTDAMLAALPEATGRSGLLYKAPKPGQDRRADLPAIGPDTVSGAARAGLAGIVIESGGVLVLDQPELFDRLEKTGLFLWSRERAM